MTYSKFAAMRRIIYLIVSCFLAFSLKAQNDVYRQYIEAYKGFAIEQMQRYGIPASITLAQGLLESAAGRSFLAMTANNHFGIKTGGTWLGAYVLKDDDRKNERFRKYDDPQQSYEDHSLFLTTRSRYASLFSLEKTDYQGWARGLKAAGYATNPKYADILINLIDLYDLTRFDRLLYKQSVPVVADERRSSHRFVSNKSSTTKEVRLCNGLKYIVVSAGDNLTKIANQIGVKERKLRKYNELPDNYVIKVGDILYLEKKASHAARTYKGRPHLVQQGESFYTIAQHYGIRLKKLYEINHLPCDYRLRVGDPINVY